MSKKVECKECSGLGYIEEEYEDEDGEWCSEEYDCEVCDGSGYVEVAEEGEK